MKNEIIIIADYTSQPSISFDELREQYNISDVFIHELIAYGIIHLDDNHPGEWIFNPDQIRKLQTTLRLQRDLEVNLAGVALVLDLLDELEKLRARAEFLDKHILKKD
jgi:chaperone modulatory protein CbpM